MKKYLFAALIAIAALSFTACSEDADNPEPTIESVSAVDNTITVTFSEGVYSSTDAVGDLTEDNLTVTITDVDFTYTVAHTAGDTEAVITLVYTSIIPEGTEVTVASATMIYDNESAAMSAGISASATLEADLGIIGEWYSSGDNVAPLLVTYFTVDSIYAEFKDDFTMIVYQFNEGNTSGTPDVTYSSNYTMEKSTVDDIWTIEIVQIDPYAAEVSGIFEINAETDVLWYEVVQTSGTQNIPPTPVTGFGSSNGGTLGDTNIQKFVRL